MEQPVEKESSVKVASPQETSDINRDVILSWLKADIQTLRKWATQSHTIKNGVRIKCLRASIYGCSVVLQALKDKEIDELAKDVEAIKEKVGIT